MKIVIIGATGFIGRKLFTALDKEEYDLTVVTRDAVNAHKVLGEHAEFCEWDGYDEARLSAIFADAGAIINLAGENIGAARWTENQRKKIITSRTNITSAVVRAINKLDKKPDVLLQASAIGFYGSDYKNSFNENSPAGKGFLAEVTQKWENAGKGLHEDVRLVLLRTGVVLAKDGGVLVEMAKPFKLGAGGYVGNGKQWLSWIHIDDEVDAIQFLMEHHEASGIFNLTAPEPETMKCFAKEIGKALKKPSWLNVPSFAIKLAMGQRGEELLLASQRVLPDRLIEAGFTFQFTEARIALANIYNS
jgi:uncharacterized protein (TIGR01777 family)